MKDKQMDGQTFAILELLLRLKRMYYLFYGQYNILLQWTIENDVEICKEVWSGVARNIFGVSTFVLQFLIPIIISGEWPLLSRLKSSHDIHFASITKQIKLVFEMSLLVFAKTNFFQISQIEYLQIQIFTNISNLLNYNHKYKIKNKTLVILQIIGPQ